MSFAIEQSPLGRVVIAPSIPAGHAVFYTTADFEGRITSDIAQTITQFIGTRFGIDA